MDADSDRATIVPAVGVLEAIRGRRSVRDFAPTRVDRSTIETLLQAAVDAPTAVHEEPWIFVVVQDPGCLARISDKAKTLWREQIAAGASSPRGTAAELDMASLAKRLGDPDFSIFYTAGTLIVIAAKPLGPFVAADCWLAAENVMLAAYGLGLGTCCIGFALGALNTPQLKMDLGVPDDAMVVAAIIVGQPAGKPASVPRKPPQIASWR
jgi:nitroreductase